MRIGYFADGPWSHRALDKIIQDRNLSVDFVCARFDKPDQQLRKNAEAAGIPFFVHEDVNSSDFEKTLSQFKSDIFVSMSFNQIFKQSIIQIPEKGIINCHAGMLPFYRGRNVLNWALINDETKFGITVHYVDGGIDTGDIILQQSYKIDDSDTYATLLERSFGYCADMLYRALVEIDLGESKRIPQNSITPVGFYCSQRKDGDEVLNWDNPSRDVFNFVRALSSPGPIAKSFVRGEEVKITKIEMVAGALSYKGIPGAILEKDSSGFVVKTEDSFVKVVGFESTVRLKVGDRFE
jgi:methionyl-tRNA formyltransferase